MHLQSRLIDSLLHDLPLPLAQLYRRAVNAKTALDRHHNAYYLAEAALKLAASVRISLVLRHGLPAQSPLAESLVQVCMASVGQWVGFLRETSRWLRGQPDAALLPLAEAHDELLRPGTIPEVAAFARRVSHSEWEEEPPLSRELASTAGRAGILGFFDLIAAYRNQVFGHGGQRLPGFYAEVGLLLLEAVKSVLNRPCLFGDLLLSVARRNEDGTFSWHGLRGPAGFPLPEESVGPTPEAAVIRPGTVYFIQPGLRLSLHPLVIYLEDRQERERVGFLNRTVMRRQEAAGVEEVRRCEYLDYATGEQLREIDARRELTLLLARLQGKSVTVSDVDSVITDTKAEGAEQEVVLSTGATIGDFELKGELGRGGMGIVYRARQRSLNREVALKVLPPALVFDALALGRFHREITALARCDHPHLVRILTSGSDGDRHYYAMELVEGSTLAELYELLRACWLQKKTALSERHLSVALSSSAKIRQTPAQALSLDILASLSATSSQGRSLEDRVVEFLSTAAEVLVHLHERGIVHRDIKPANLMLTTDSKRLVVMDLGLALLREDTGQLTRPRQFIGTLRYASPEQVASLAPVDERSDVYSLGATFWELLTLQPLFGGDRPGVEAELVRKIQFEEPDSIRKYRRAVPVDLEAIVFKCLEKNPTRRYASARDLLADLNRFRQGEPVLARRRTWRYRLLKKLRRNRRRLVSWTTVVLVLAFCYLLLADIGLRVPGGERIRRALDEVGISMCRPVSDEEATLRRASGMRRELAHQLVKSTNQDLWVHFAMRSGRQEKPDVWTQGQAMLALASAPETDGRQLNRLCDCFPAMFESQPGIPRFDPRRGWHMSNDKDWHGLVPAAWTLAALARALHPASPLTPEKRHALRGCLDRLEATVDHYRSRDRDERCTGGWNLFVDQDDSSVSCPYSSAMMLLALLELKRSDLPWKGSPSVRDELLHGTAAHVRSRFVFDPSARRWGWTSVGRQEDAWSDGLTLINFALLLRAEAEAGLDLPDQMLPVIETHLQECGERPFEFDTGSTSTLGGEPFTDAEGKKREHVTTQVRFLWYPWSIACAALWRQRLERHNAPHYARVQGRRVLGHLILDLGDRALQDALSGYAFVAAETLFCLSALDPPPKPE
jgi:serine/threonine protein kinase